MLARRSFSALTEPCLRRVSALQRWVPLTQVCSPKQWRVDTWGEIDSGVSNRHNRDSSLYRTVKKLPSSKDKKAQM